MATAAKFGAAAATSFQPVLSSAPAIGSSSRRDSMARKRYQRGSVSLIGKTWIGRYREDQIGIDGITRRIKRAVVLGTKKELPTKHLAERRLEVHLAPINAFSYRPGRMATIGE